ncbi:MAG: aminotransferase class V-fold PLP-dependent enzyme [Clostridia bacterium]|nr:aminotransferase class V-fold PLP-dependent enzyme [Clostridia bacterium]
MSVYLDFNASAPIDSRVLDYMVDVYKTCFGNADSRTHEFGTTARRIVENARSSFAELLGIKKEEVFFTSGATESNNIALQGLMSYALESNRKHIITTSIEHKAVLETVKHLASEGFEVDFIDPDPTGRISAEKIKRLIRKDTLLVSVMHVNNETGVIQPVQEIGEFLSDTDVFFHIDATQSFGKLVTELKNIHYDMLSMSAHKMGGPQGIGALVLIKKHFRLPPVKGIMYGGKQEHGIRPGTIPVALVAGLGKACEYVAQEHEDNIAKCIELRKCVIELLEKSRLPYEINGNIEYIIPNTLNLCIPGVSSEALMLSSKQFCGISNGSACNSSSYEPSYVLKAMGLSNDRIENSIRISWGASTNQDELTVALKYMLNMAKSMIE